MSTLSRGVAKLLDRAGSEARILTGFEGDTTVKAIIQPMRYKNKMYLSMDRNELGFRDNECFLYIGPPVPDFCGAEHETIIKTEDRSYGVSRADRISFGGEVVYIWAVLTLRIKENGYDKN